MPLISPSNPGPLRIIAAFFYDSVLLFGLLLLATTAVVLPANLLFGIENVGSHPLFRLWLVGVVLIFYLWFWSHGGQTLGMRAWRLRVVDEEGNPVTLFAATMRLAMGLLMFGITLLWIYFDSENRSLHDRLARTRLLLLPKQRKSGHT